MTRINGFEQFAEELDEFADALDEIADELDGAIHNGTQKTAYQVEGTAKHYAPVDDGGLRADISAIPLAPGVYSVGTTKKYGPPTEYGSRPHPITPNGPYPLKFFWDKKGEWVTTYGVEHPGTPSQPFLRPALNKHRTDLIENIRMEIRKVIDEHT